MDTFILTIKCPDRVGIVAAVSKFLADYGGWITEAHHHSIDHMVRLGQDIERLVLARGLRYHLEDRILVHENKTIVFN